MAQMVRQKNRYKWYVQKSRSGSHFRRYQPKPSLLASEDIPTFGLFGGLSLPCPSCVVQQSAVISRLVEDVVGRDDHCFCRALR